MFTQKVIAMFIGLLAVVTLASQVGCQSSAIAGERSMTAPQRAVVVTGGNGGGTVVFIPTADNSSVQTLNASGAPVCDECRADAIKYFQTGKLDSKCPKCGATRIAVMRDDETVGHN